jgi:hypothetical protein
MREKTGGSPLEIKISLTILDASFLSLGENGFAYLFFQGLFLPWILCPNAKGNLNLLNSYLSNFPASKVSKGNCKDTF